MKTTLLVTLLLGSLAQAASMTEMKAHLPTGTYNGVQGGSKRACSIEVNWISDTEVKVKALVQTSAGKIQVRNDILFSEEKKAQSFLENSNEISLEQSKDIVDEDGNEATLGEKVVVYMDEGQLKEIEVQTVAFDGESDPLEDLTFCEIQRQ